MSNDDLLVVTRERLLKGVFDSDRDEIIFVGDGIVAIVGEIFVVYKDSCIFQTSHILRRVEGYDQEFYKLDRTAFTYHMPFKYFFVRPKQPRR